MDTGRVVVVSGASKGIGLALCRHALERGATVVGLSRSEATLDEPNYRHFVADVTDEKRVGEVFRTIRRELKRVNVLINNAAIAASQFTVMTSLASAEAVFKTNVLGSFLLAREATKLMMPAKFGRIIHISSMLVPLAPAGGAMYSASKSALTQFSKVLAKEVADHHITSNVVGISAVETDMWKDIPEERLKALIAQLPLKRAATMADVTNVVDFFASPASGQITGQVVYLGGVA